MDYSTAIVDNRTHPTPIGELTSAELDAVAGGAASASYNVFYSAGYWIGEAVAWLGAAAAGYGSYASDNAKNTGGVSMMIP